MTGWLFDVASASKALRATRWTSLAAIATLALGTGASTAVLGLVYSAILRPLPFRDQDRLVVISRTYGPSGHSSTTMTLAELGRWRAAFTAASDLAGYAIETMTIRGEAQPRSVRGGVVAGDLFGELGVPMLAGRGFADRDAPDAAVISRAFAQRVAGSSADALGHAIVVGDRARRVVGVLPDAFDLVEPDVDVWLPASGVPALNTFGPGDVRSYHAVARLAPGVPAAAARDQAARVHAELLPGGQGALRWRIALIPLRDALIGDSRPVLIALAAAAGLLLLVACANVATLLVNRTVVRSRETTLRLALGASYVRLVRTALFETAAIAVAGAAAGWGSAPIFVRLLRPVLPGIATAPGVPLAGTAAILAVGVTFVCGLAPVLAVNRTRLASALGEREGTGSRTSRRVRDVLVVAQVAVAVVLLAGAGLLGRTLLFLRHTDIGVRDPGGVLTLRLALTETTKFDDRARASFVGELVERIRHLPGVVAAGVGSNLPPDESQMKFTVRVIADNVDQTRAFDFVSVTDGYLDALHAAVLRGRLFTAGDRLGDRAAAVLSESAARHLEPIGDPLDKTLSLSLPSATGQRVKPYVVGVIRDIRYNGLDTSGLGSVYVRWRQLPMGTAYLVVRTAGDSAALAPAVLRVARALDPSLPLAEPRTLDEEIQRTLAPRATRFAVVGLFAAVALALAVVGLSGALIRGVLERRRELAIRTALGATPRRVIALVVSRGLWLALSGLAVGVGAGLAAGRGFAALVFGVSPYDATTYLAIGGGTIALALASCFLPARRAASVNPLDLLRSE